MRLKLDENLGHLVQELFRQASHDVATVAGERLSSATDRDVIEACQRERRCLVTLDLDLANLCLGKRVTPHILRHTAAMELLQAGIDRSLFLWLGVRSRPHKYSSKPTWPSKTRFSPRPRQRILGPMEDIGQETNCLRFLDSLTGSYGERPKEHLGPTVDQRR